MRRNQRVGWNATSDTRNWRHPIGTGTGADTTGTCVLVSVLPVLKLTVPTNVTRIISYLAHRTFRFLTHYYVKTHRYYIVLTQNSINIVIVVVTIAIGSEND